MDIKVLIYLLCLVCIVSTVSEHINIVSSKCEVNIGSCNYKLTLVPSNQCHDNNFSRSRSKRSGDSDYEIGNLAAELISLQTDFKKLEKKLVKEMRSLSTRVLRGARRMEDIAYNEDKSKTKNNCPQRFVTLGNMNSCYMFSKFNTTWYEAKEYCLAMGGDLVALGNVQEHYLVAFYIQNNPEYQHATGWWTSGRILDNSGKWMWSNNGQSSPVTYSKWAINEPNDHLDKNLQCIMMYRIDDMLWYDQICSDRYNFVCEKTNE